MINKTISAIARGAAGIFMACFLLSGCASGPMINSSTGSDKALVFGFFNISEENEPYKMWINSIKFRKVTPPSADPDFYCDWMLGTLFFAFVEPGFYRLEEFKARGLISREFLIFKNDVPAIITYRIPVQGNGYKFEQPGGMYFFGTYEVRNETLKMFQESSFDMRRLYYPTEEDVIVRLLEETEKGCYWEGALKKRLAQLRQWRIMYERNKKKKSAPAR